MTGRGNFLLLAVLLTLFAPQMVFAVWWNPFSWFDNWTFSREPVVEVQLSEDSEDTFGNIPTTKNEDVVDNDSNKDILTNPPFTQDQDMHQNEEAPSMDPEPPLPVSEIPVDEDVTVVVHKPGVVDLKICHDKCSDGSITAEAGDATFKWTSENVTSCFASGDVIRWSGSKPTSGSVTFYAGNEKYGEETYSLTCTDKSGRQISDSVHVKFTYTPKPTVNLMICEEKCTGGPLIREAGNRKFKWNTTNAVSCIASGDTFWSGSKSVNDSETVWTGNEKTGETTYVLTCKNSVGALASDSVTITFEY